MSACGQCGSGACGGCGSLVVPEGPVGPTGAAGSNGAAGADGTDGAPGYVAFSFSLGADTPFIRGGSTTGKYAAYLPWPGTSLYPAMLAMQRMFLNAYGSAVSPNYDIEIHDITNGNAIVASTYGKTNTGVGDVYALTINPANFSTTRAVWGIFIVDNNASNDKVNIQSLTMEV